MVFAKGFFDLQFSFAEKVRDLSGTPLEVALIEYTNFYVRFGLGRDFDSSHETWLAYLAGLRGAGDAREWTYAFYLREPEAMTAPAVEATFGCFSYALSGGDCVRLHFRNTETNGRSPLETARFEQRYAELSALFAHLKPRVSEDIPIVGASWLYNLTSYRRLFPSGYTSTASPIRGGFRSMPLWGQFLDRGGEVRESMAGRFLGALGQCSNLGRVNECFPMQALAARAPAHQFYDFYGV